MSVTEDLFVVATKLAEYSNRIKSKNFSEPLDKLEKVANEVGKAWSGSWLGYHSRVYYEDLKEPPAGARFSQEWGIEDRYGTLVQGAIHRSRPACPQKQRGRRQALHEPSGGISSYVGRAANSLRCDHKSKIPPAYCRAGGTG